MRAGNGSGGAVPRGLWRTSFAGAGVAVIVRSTRVAPSLTLRVWSEVVGPRLARHFKGVSGKIGRVPAVVIADPDYSDSPNRPAQVHGQLASLKNCNSNSLRISCWQWLARGACGR